MIIDNTRINLILSVFQLAFIGYFAYKLSINYGENSDYVIVPMEILVPSGVVYMWIHTIPNINLLYMLNDIVSNMSIVIATMMILGYLLILRVLFIRNILFIMSVLWVFWFVLMFSVPSNYLFFIGSIMFHLYGVFWFTSIIFGIFSIIFKLFNDIKQSRIK